MRVSIKTHSLVTPIFLTVLLSCTTKHPKPNQSGSAPTQARLTQSQARKRAEVVSNTKYTIEFDLTVGDKQFSASEKIDFTLSKVTKDLFLDFQNGQVTALEINGQKIASPNYDGLAIKLDGSMLKVGPNSILLSYRGTYSNEGTGLYRFVDPEDKGVYLYTMFEPFDANRVFPCFDQPDLKATFAIKVLAPKEWTVITATSPTLQINQGDKKIWDFGQTLPMSTYLVSLHAGPYAQWTSSAGKIPLRLFARQSLARYVDPKEWFDTTKQGLKFFPKYFESEYPFKKYDQVIVPDFNFGAMENIAAVTFSENYISRAKKTVDQRQRLAETLLHEMAHMWFGNLVTMRWWNDLWLNESFATYMAVLAMVNATEHKGSWTSFFTDEKAWGYWEDQLVTTHPIESVVPDTTQAFTQFDGITYAKGASSVKQLAFFVGEENFRKGMANYFDKFQFSNTERADFVRAISDASGKDLSEWSRLWLSKAGTDKIQTLWSCDQDKISSFVITQKAPVGESEFRPHRTQLGFYFAEQGTVKLGQTLAVSYQGASTKVSEAIGLKCPHLVNPNEGDFDFVVSLLDPVTTKNLSTSINQIDSPFSRAMFWSALYDMVRNAQVAADDLAPSVISSLRNEKDPYVLALLFKILEGGKYNEESSLLFYAVKNQNRLLIEAEAALWANVIESKPGSDRQKHFFDSYVRTAKSSEALTRLNSMLTGKARVKGLKIDQDRRWTLVKRLVSMGHEQGLTRLSEEMTKDKSEMGVQAALMAQASQADLEVKKNYLSKATADDETLSHGRKRSMLRGLFPSSQLSARTQLGEQVYSALSSLNGKRSDEFLSTLAETAAPFACDAESSQRATRFLESHGRLPSTIAKPVKVGRQENDRCLMIRAKSLSSQAQSL
jgi:aminopeptidase N